MKIVGRQLSRKENVTISTNVRIEMGNPMREAIYKDMLFDVWYVTNTCIIFHISSSFDEAKSFYTRLSYANKQVSNFSVLMNKLDIMLEDSKFPSEDALSLLSHIENHIQWLSENKWIVSLIKIGPFKRYILQEAA